MDLSFRTPRFMVLSVVALGVMICLTPRRASADAIVTVGGTTYDITTTTGTLDAVFPTISTTPWYSDESGALALSVAAEVAAGLGYPNGPPTFPSGPFFAYTFGPSAPGSMGIAEYYAPTELAVSGEVGFYDPNIYTWATATVVNTPEPGTITLLLAGLLALGLIGGVKRYRGSGLPTQV